MMTPLAGKIMSYLLTVHHLSIKRGDMTLCRHIDCTVRQGDIVHLAGENGLGKTTLLMQLMGLLPTDEGNISHPKTARPLYIAHQAGISDVLTVEQNLCFLMALYDIKPSDDELDMALECVGLYGYRHMSVSRLSAGQVRRVGLARLWLVLPKITPLWVLDEPLTALDVAMVERLCGRLKMFANQGGGVLLTSHQPIEVATKLLDLTAYRAFDDDIQPDLNPVNPDTKTDKPLKSDSLGAMGADVFSLFVREWQIKSQGTTQWIQPLVIFLMIMTLFPLAIGSEMQTLERLGVPIVWIAVIVSLIMGMDGLFKSEFDNGTLSQIVVSGTPLALWVLVRVGVHWLFGAGCVALLSLLSAPLFGLKMTSALVLAGSIIVGSPMLLMLCAIASALTLSAKNGAVLIPLIAIPMQLPVLIFATGAVERYMMGMPSLPVFALLLAGSIVALMISPLVIALSLKLSWQS